MCFVVSFHQVGNMLLLNNVTSSLMEKPKKHIHTHTHTPYSIGKLACSCVCPGVQSLNQTVMQRGDELLPHSILT